MASMMPRSSASRATSLALAEAIAAVARACCCAAVSF
jgi:hypothetical protein